MRLFSEKVFTALCPARSQTKGTMNTLKKSPEQGYRDFDLPVAHLSSNRDYIPPKTHDRAEAARRRDLNPGTLRYEMQERGLIVARTILQEVTEEEARMFASDMLGKAMLNSAWYSYAQRRTDVMRRRLKLPIMLHDRNRDASTLYEDTVAMVGRAGDYAHQLVIAHECMPERVDARQHDVGRVMGNAGLRLALVSPVVRGEFPLPGHDTEEPLSDKDMQDKVRMIAMSTLTDARMMAGQAQVHPSVAQLADPYSPLSVHWYRSAPGSAQTAITDALAA